MSVRDISLHFGGSTRICFRGIDLMIAPVEASSILPFDIVESVLLVVSSIVVVVVSFQEHHG